MEVYNVKNTTFFTELGKFENNQISITNGYLYLRRMDLNGTKLILNYGVQRQNSPQNKIQRAVLQEIVTMMNTQYNRIYFNEPSFARTFRIPGDALEELFPFQAIFFKFDMIAPTYKSL